MFSLWIRTTTLTELNTFNTYALLLIIILASKMAISLRIETVTKMIISQKMPGDSGGEIGFNLFQINPYIYN